MPRRKNIKIEVRNSSFYCDLCGMQQYTETNITFPDKTTLKLEGDTHLGGGPVQEHEILICLMEHMEYPSYVEQEEKYTWEQLTAIIEADLKKDGYKLVWNRIDNDYEDDLVEDEEYLEEDDE